MKPLIPDLERQLRRAHKRLGDHGETGGWPGRAREPKRTLGTIVAACTVAFSLLIAGVIVFTVHSHNAHAPAGPPAYSPFHRKPLSATAYSPTGGRSETIALGNECNPKAGATHFESVATGSIAGRSWHVLFPARDDKNAKRLVMIGHQTFPLCTSIIYTKLIGSAPRGIAYGFIPNNNGRVAKVNVGPAGGHVTVETRTLNQGSFFIAALPHPGCYYGTLAVSGRQANGSGESSTITLGPCRRNELVPTYESTGKAPPVLFGELPSGLSHAQLAELQSGEETVESSGCEGCHEIAGQGNNGPGPNLSHIGSKLDRAQLQHALLDPRAPMPSFKNLPKRQLRALLYFLQELRSTNPPSP